MTRRRSPVKADASSPFRLHCLSSIRPPDVLGRRILITGDINTGKTTLSKAILDALCASRLSSRIAVVDMAPEIPEEVAVERDVLGVGGKLLSDDKEVLYLASPLRPPRLSARTEKEALLIAEENREKIAVLLKTFASSGRDILFVNDVSLYLHAGTTERLMRYMAAATTIVANGYYGEKLGSGIVSLREATEMRKLIDAFLCHITLPAASLGQKPSVT